MAMLTDIGQMIFREVIQPVLITAVSALGAYALWRLQRYLERLQQRQKLETDMELVQAAVSAAEQLYSSPSVRKQAVGEYVRKYVSDDDAYADTLIEAAVLWLNRANAGDGEAVGSAEDRDEDPASPASPL